MSRQFPWINYLGIPTHEADETARMLLVGTRVE